MAEVTSGTDQRTLDPESRAWVDALAGSGPEHDDAVARLHALLERAARFELARRGRHDDLEDLATQAASDAVMAIMRKLDTYRGDSRFTTWAYKFGLLEAAVKARRRAWQQRELPLTGDWDSLLADRRAAPDVDVETGELLGAIGESIATDLTDHQRTVLVALALNGVPVDVLAERMSTTRGALYKTLHDARKRLRSSLAERGLAIGELQTGGTP